MHDDNNTPSAADLLELNRDLQGSRAIRLLATTNLSLYATLTERHLNDGAVPETEFVVRLERDLVDLDDPQSGLALVKSWAAQGWLHRIVDERHDTNVCYLTQDARRALDFLSSMRRQDTIATGGSITGIAARLKQVAVKVDNDPARIRKHIEAEIASLHEELDALDWNDGPSRLPSDLTDCYDEARAIALQMERLGLPGPRPRNRHPEFDFHRTHHHPRRHRYLTNSKLPDAGCGTVTSKVIRAYTNCSMVEQLTARTRSEQSDRSAERTQ